jgi:hypothetical protein
MANPLNDMYHWSGGLLIAIFVVAFVSGLVWIRSQAGQSNFNYAEYQAAQARASQRAEILAEVHRQDVQQTALSLRGY